MSDADEVSSEVSEDLASVDNVDNSGSFEGSYQSYRSNTNKKSSPAPYPEIPGKTPAKAADDDYSFSFEGSQSESNLYKSYSQDFETDDVNLPKMTPGHAPPIRSSAVAPTSLLARHLPTMELQSLQAEMSLQHLSEEVIQLRNKQRALLKERWNQVKEKKARAGERRNKYHTELNELQQRVVELEGSNKNFSVINANLTAELKAAKNSIEVLESTNERTLKISETKDEAIAVLNGAMSDHLSDFDELKADSTAQAVAMAKRKEEYHSEILKKELQLEVLGKSMEASELRFSSIENIAVEGFRQFVFKIYIFPFSASSGLKNSGRICPVITNKY
jgi:hypothetical protein